MYSDAPKKVKSQLLDEFKPDTADEQKVFRYLLRSMARVVCPVSAVRVKADPSVNNIHNRHRKKLYTDELKKPLLEIWQISGVLNSKLLVVYIRGNKDKLKVLQKVL